MGCGAGKGTAAQQSAESQPHTTLQEDGLGKRESAGKDASPALTDQEDPAKVQDSEQPKTAADEGTAPPGADASARCVAGSSQRKSGDRIPADEPDSLGPGGADASPKISPQPRKSLPQSKKNQPPQEPPEVLDSIATAPAPDVDQSQIEQDLSSQPMTSAEMQKISTWIDQVQGAKAIWLPLPDVWGEVKQEVVQMLEDMEREKRSRAAEREADSQRKREKQAEQEAAASKSKSDNVPADPAASADAKKTTDAGPSEDAPAAVK